MPVLASLSAAFNATLAETKSEVILFELHERDDAIIPESHFRFQYFPESITDSKVVEYQQKAVPGGSLPLYQWVSSGERVISFSAWFSADMDLTQDDALYERLRQTGQAHRNAYIPAALLWLRRFVLPRYGELAPVGVPMTFAPRKCRLFIPYSGIGLVGGCGGTNEVTAASIICVMTQCDITYEAFFPSGAPRAASVQLAFAQVPQSGGMVAFPAATDALDEIVKENYRFRANRSFSTVASKLKL